jgi:putative addiction module component (TIGR02574 family)
MAKDTSDLLSEALALPDEQRARLARQLIDSLEVNDEESSAAEVEAAWEGEIERRVAELDADPTLVTPAAEVFAEAERQLQEIRTARERRKRPA